MASLSRGIEQVTRSRIAISYQEALEEHLILDVPYWHICHARSKMITRATMEECTSGHGHVGWPGAHLDLGTLSDGRALHMEGLNYGLLLLKAAQANGWVS